MHNHNDCFLDRSPWIWVIISLILASVLVFSLETIPTLEPAVYRGLQIADHIILGLFIIEYIARVATSPNKKAYIFSFYGLVDIIAIVPSLLLLTVDLQSLRVLRMLRILRLLKLARYNAAILRFAKAISEAKEELVVFVMASLFMLYVAAVGIYHFENPAQPEVFKSIFDCLWWAVATLTTVGYGDIYPITVGGRLFTFLVLLVGLGLIAVPTGIIASALSAVRRKEEREGD